MGMMCPLTRTLGAYSLVTRKTPVEAAKNMEAHAAQRMDIGCINTIEPRD
ncbi:hypothetical protein RugamoR64_44180 [Duganella rhizosphaerae]